ncbi:MAG: hypothetical protein V7L21_31595 [Nostoc sp.]|nr:hypothetical protein [Nostoc sp. NMS9]MBN3940187.1 hypothetical protein [Nostoc sp. NMS9]
MRIDIRKRSPVLRSALFDFCKRSPRKFIESAIAVAVINFPKQNVP